MKTPLVAKARRLAFEDANAIEFETTAEARSFLRGHFQAHLNTLMTHDIRKQAEEKVREEAKRKNFSTMTAAEVRRWYQERYRINYRKLHLAKTI